MKAGDIENRLHLNYGLLHVVGIDEAGRGPLAGPVVAAAVIFPPFFELDGVADSKKLSPVRREKLIQNIFDSAISIGVSVVGETVIDDINILQATRIAMLKAVSALSVEPQHLLIDGNRAIDSYIPQTTIIKGDSTSLAIASASIVAKVTRDRLMDELDLAYPQYLFKKHKGYGTKEHLARIKEFGPSPVHRKSFKGVKEWI
ncbi:MAG: ribonuclease HII [Nitrospinae bacterium]|nr:ribonuclease HII [Nitrospinota bacterium]